MTSYEPYQSNFKANEFSSRKLWELVNKQSLNDKDDLHAAISELTERQHYLPQLQALHTSTR